MFPILPQHYKSDKTQKYGCPGVNTNMEAAAFW